MHLSNHGTKILNRLLSIQVGTDSPFIYDNNQLYLQYDQITISNTDGPTQSANIDFIWRGDIMMSTKAPNFHITGDTTLTLTGMEGRQKVDIL